MKKFILHNISVILCLINILAAILCCFWLTSLPTDPKNNFIGNYSVQRLISLGGIVLSIFIFFIIGVLSIFLREKMIEFIHLTYSKFSNWIVSGFFLLNALCFLSIVIIIFPPPSIFPSGSALFERLLPILLIFTFWQIQAIILIYLYASQKIINCIDTAITRINHIESSKYFCYFLLLLSTIIAISQVYYVYYNIGDEGDTIAVGWLISKGWVLYKDVFSHHFPFPYLFLALVIKVFGASILLVRLSLIFLRTFCVGIAMKMSRFNFPLSLMALCWSLFGHLYLGNSLLYHSFSSIFLICGLSIGIAFISDFKIISTKGLFTMGLFCGLAVMCDPLKIFPVISIFIILMISISLQKHETKIRIHTIKFFAILFMSFLTSIAGYLIYALITQSLTDFYQNAILFNSTIYSKYSPMITFNDVIHSLSNGLDILNPVWYENLTPFYQWRNYTFVDNWFNTGFFYRFITLISCIICFIHRKFLLGLAVYVLSALTILRSAIGFGASPFILFSVFICAWIISEKNFIYNQISSTIEKSLNYSIIFIKITLIIMLSWLSIRGTMFLLDDTTKLSYERNFSGVIGDVAYYKKLICNHDEARLLVYPINPIIYFLAQIPPASKYLFMTPWTAEIGQEDAINGLKENPTVLFINRRTNLWNHPVEQYSADLLKYVDQYYIQDQEKIYISPLLKECK